MSEDEEVENAELLNDTTTQDTTCYDAEASCLQCQDKDRVITSLQSEYESLNAEKDQLKEESNCLKQEIKKVQSEAHMLQLITVAELRIVVMNKKLLYTIFVFLIVIL